MLARVSLVVTRLSLLVDLSSLLTREVDLDSLLATACERIAAALDADRATIWLVDAERGDLVTRVALLPELAELRQPLDRGIAGHVAQSGETVCVADAASDPRFDPTADRATGYTTRSTLVCAIRKTADDPVRGVLQLLNRKRGAFDGEDARYVEALATQLARAFELTTLRAAVRSSPGLTLRGPFNHIVGRSPAMQQVYRRIALAAQTDAGVLLRGETGTGKGLFARAIHVNSARGAGPFVTVDCTTLPAQLAESELFGHERGAFTGADRKVPGKVELAAGGTLFLDEIGDLALESQGKLLRFLQEKSFERVGGRETLRADARIVCATHRDLEQAISEGKFREDLYFRVRVVTIDVPPLRERGPEEIEILARHFAERYARRYGRREPRFDPRTLAALAAHDFRGNVRELEHWIESAIVLAEDGCIGPDLLPQSRRAPERKAAASESLADPTADAGQLVLPLGLTLDEATCRYVEAVLADSGGNKTEAARRLGVGRNTVARAMNPKRRR
jgi:Nif-specific regulatory protein